MKKFISLREPGSVGLPSRSKISIKTENIDGVRVCLSSNNVWLVKVFVCFLDQPLVFPCESQDQADELHDEIIGSADA